MLNWMLVVICFTRRSQHWRQSQTQCCKQCLVAEWKCSRIQKVTFLLAFDLLNRMQSSGIIAIVVCMKITSLIIFVPHSGWIMIDRCGTHFGTIMNFLRDGSVPLPETTKGVAELLAEAKYYCITELIDSCERALLKKVKWPNAISHHIIFLSTMNSLCCLFFIARNRSQSRYVVCHWSHLQRRSKF